MKESGSYIKGLVLIGGASGVRCTVGEQTSVGFLAASLLGLYLALRLLPYPGVVQPSPGPDVAPAIRRRLQGYVHGRERSA